MSRNASWLLPVLLLCGLCLAKDVGDFAPLAVGNIWIYQGFRSGWRTGYFGGEPVKPFSHEVRRKIQVESKTVYADSDLYRIVLVDSMYHRKVDGFRSPDSVAWTVVYIAEHSGVLYPDPDLNVVYNDNLGSTMLFDCFRSHVFDSDSVRTKLIGNALRQVAAESLSSVEIRRGDYGIRRETEWIRDVGVHFWATHYWSHPEGLEDSAAFSLMSFNSETVNLPTAVKPTVNRPERVSGSLGNIPGRWHGYDLSGRRAGKKPLRIEP